MKINFVIPFIYRVGGVKLIFEYANHLAQRGHDVVVYSPIYPYNTHKGQFNIMENARRFYRLFVQQYRLNDNLKKFKKIAFILKQVPFIKNNFVRDADAVIATAWPTAYSVYNLLPSKGRKFYLIQDYEIWESNVELVDKSYMLDLNRITTCEYLRSLLMNKFGVESTIVFNGIDLSVFHNNDKVFDVPRRLLFIDSGMPRKNSILAIKVIERLHNNFPDIKFNSFGHRKFHEMPEYIEFVENPSDGQIRELYSESDIFICTSIEEGFATPPAEAMACKCAVVTSLVGAVTEYSTNMVSAIHYGPGDEDGLFNSVKYLLEHKEEWKKISLSGYENAKNILDCWDDSTLKLERLLQGSLTK